MYLTQALKRVMQLEGRNVATVCADRVHTWNECGERIAKLVD